MGVGGLLAGAGDGMCVCVWGGGGGGGQGRANTMAECLTLVVMICSR